MSESSRLFVCWRSLIQNWSWETPHPQRVWFCYDERIKSSLCVLAFFDTELIVGNPSPRGDPGGFSFWVVPSQKTAKNHSNETPGTRFSFYLIPGFWLESLPPASWDKMLISPPKETTVSLESYLWNHENHHKMDSQKNGIIQTWRNGIIKNLVPGFWLESLPTVCWEDCTQGDPRGGELQTIRVAEQMYHPYRVGLFPQKSHIDKALAAKEPDVIKRVLESFSNIQPNLKKRHAYSKHPQTWSKKP